MANISTSIIQDSEIVNLKEVSTQDVRMDVFNLLIPGEEIKACFQTVRDQVVFTSKRLFVINVQGVTGKKTSYFSYPYSKVQYFAVETAGVLDIDSEQKIIFNDGSHLQQDFKSRVDIKNLCWLISQYVL